MTIYQVVLKQTFHSQQLRNIYYYETTVGDPSTSEWQDIVDEVRTELSANLAAFMNNKWSFQGLDYRIVDTAGLPTQTVAPTAGDLVGGSATDSTATQVAMVVNVKGSTAKPRLGRTFLAGWYKTALVSGLFGAGSRGAAETFIDLMSGINAAGTNPLQRVAAQWNTSRTLVTATNNIAAVAAVATAVPATLRSRRIGRGI